MPTSSLERFVCVEGLWTNQPIESCRAQSVYLTTALRETLFSHIMYMYPRYSPKMSALFPSTGQAFTSTTEAINVGCCDKIF